MDYNLIYQSCALFFTSTYFGGITYQCVVENPARLGCETGALLDQWVGSLNNCQKYFPILLLPSVASSLLAYYYGGCYLWVISASLVFTIFPLTGIFLFSKYNKLQNIQKKKIEAKPEEIRSTIKVVGYYHMFKAVLSGAATLLILYLYKRN
jgi:hypothetical protein